LCARAPDARALSPGESWLTVRDLLADAATRAAAPGGRGARLVRAADPVTTVAEMLAAQIVGEVPVVVLPDTPAKVTDALLDAAAREPSRRGLDPRTPLLVVLTSGTGGTPRAVVRTEASWSASLAGYSKLTGQTTDDVAWAPGAPASTLTLFALWHALATGVPVVATGRWRGVPAGGPATGATVVHAVPAVAADVVAARLDGALRALRRIVVAGAAVPATLREAARRAGVDLVEYYGAAELSFVAADADGRGLRAFPGVRLRVRDERIEVRSPYLALGYLGDVPGPLSVDAEGWASVGDLGRLGPDGILEVTGRGEDAICVGGCVVLAADVEAVLARVPGVADAVCVGEPHDRLGERVVAVVQPRPGEDWPALRARLRAEARKHLPEPARPVRLVARAELPRTHGGKVARGLVRAQLPTLGR
jgi:long-chain acyl-CoA synthetase